MVPLNTVEKPAFKSMLQKFDKRVAGQNLLFRDCCAENVQHGKDIDQNGAYECWLLFCHNRYVVKCQYDSLYESNGSLSQHGMDSDITLPRNSVYARKPHIRQFYILVKYIETNNNLKCSLYFYFGRLISPNSRCCHWLIFIQRFNGQYSV